jgi:hypothetical protein
MKMHFNSRYFLESKRTQASSQAYTKLPPISSPKGGILRSNGFVENPSRSFVSQCLYAS